MKNDNSDLWAEEILKAVAEIENERYEERDESYDYRPSRRYAEAYEESCVVY